MVVALRRCFIIYPVLGSSDGRLHVRLGSRLLSAGRLRCVLTCSYVFGLVVRFLVSVLGGCSPLVGGLWFLGACGACFHFLYGRGGRCCVGIYQPTEAYSGGFLIC